MACTYLFFQPKRLPLSPHELGLDTVVPLTDPVAVKAALGTVMPTLEWRPEGWAQGETPEGQWLEFSIAPGGTLGMRCSLRADYRAHVQRLCDALGWVAVDERPFCFQPHRDPVGV